MMKYENEKLVLEIPVHTEEFDTIGLSAMLTYISRRNPEIIRQMEVQDLSMETVLQEYYQVISREGMALLEQKYLKESHNGKRAVSDTAEARMAYTQLEEVLEAELGESFQKDGYYVAEQELEELGIQLDAEEEVLLKKEQLLALWERLEETKEGDQRKNRRFGSNQSGSLISTEKMYRIPERGEMESDRKGCFGSGIRERPVKTFMDRGGIDEYTREDVYAFFLRGAKKASLQYIKRTRRTASIKYG